MRLEMLPGLLAAGILVPCLCGQQPPAVAGQVVDSVTGEPVATVHLRLTCGGTPQYVNTDAQGHFAFAERPAGACLLATYRPGYSDAQQNVPSDSGAATDMRLTIVKRAVLSGRLTDPGGAPFPFTYVQIMQPGAAPGSGPRSWRFQGTATVNDHGEYRLSLAPGTYYLMVGGGNFDTWPSSYKTTYFPGTTDGASAKPLELKPGGEASADIQIIERAGVGVNVHIAQDLPPTAPGARYATSLSLRLEPDWTHSGPQGSTSDGHYEFPDVPPGKYRLDAITFEYPADSTRRPWPVAGVHTTVEVGKNEVQDVNVQLRRLPQISGEVRYEDGCAPVPVRVQLSNGSWGDPAEAATSADWSFTIPSVTPGHTWLTVQPFTAGGAVPRTVSMKFGDRDVSQGFEYPDEAGDHLVVTLGCARGGSK